MKKIIVKNGDYELYRILLPWKCLFSGFGKRFIVGELEKQHPRFSGACCYDTQYSLDKKNLMAEVVVMDRANLAEYKQAGGELFLENPRQRCVFSGRRRLIRFFSLLLIIIAGILSFRIVRSFFSSEEKLAQAVEISLDEEPQHIEEKMTLSSLKTTVPDILLSVSRRGGKIDAFSCNAQLFLEKNIQKGMCAFSIRGCNCEDVANARYSVVSFKNNEPYFELLLPFEECIFTDDGEAEKTILLEEDSDKSIARVRKELQKFGVLIESEHNGSENAEFSFLVPASSLYSCLKICGEEAGRLGWRETFLSLSEKGGYCKVKTSFLKNGFPSSFSLLLTCAKFAYLFTSEKKAGQTKNFAGDTFSEHPLKVVSPEVKIGEIKKNDGSIFICYRKKSGKIACEKKELVNEIN